MKKTKAKTIPINGANAERADAPATSHEALAGDTKSAVTAKAMKSPGEAPHGSDALRARVQELEDNLLRAKADYQNLLRRTAGERAEAVLYGNADLMKAFLGVADDFERALEAAKTSENHEAVVEGVRLVYENLMRALSVNGLEPIAALHQPFDPSVHEAMMRQPTDEHPPGVIVQEIAKGYRLRDRVVRPAKVVVAAAPANEKDDP